MLYCYIVLTLSIVYVGQWFKPVAGWSNPKWMPRSYWMIGLDLTYTFFFFSFFFGLEQMCNLRYSLFTGVK